MLKVAICKLATSRHKQGFGRERATTAIDDRWRLRDASFNLTRLFDNETKFSSVSGVSVYDHLMLMQMSVGAFSWRICYGVDKYVENILQEIVIPFSHSVGKGFILIHSPAVPHTIHVMFHHPPHTPVLNSIEHIWNQFQRSSSHTTYASSITVGSLRKTPLKFAQGL
ncbi:hypothetical protein Trydic_g4523 [Trypoxylus dichotomus]